MVGKITHALGDLVGLGALVSPFSQLTGRANVRRRLQLAERAMALIAGEDPEDLMKELRGHNNKTADHIAESYGKLKAAIDARKTKPGSYARFLFATYMMRRVKKKVSVLINSHFARGLTSPPRERLRRGQGAPAPRRQIRQSPPPASSRRIKAGETLFAC